MTISDETRAAALAARQEGRPTTRTTHKGCDGTDLKPGDEVKVKPCAKYPIGSGKGTVVSVFEVNLGDHAYTEIGVHFGPVHPRHVTEYETNAWFRDDELTLLFRPSVSV